MARVLATFPIDLNLNYLNEYLQQHFRLSHCAIVYRRGDRHSYVDNGLFIRVLTSNRFSESFPKWRAKWSMSHERVHLYIARAVKGDINHTITLSEKEVKEQHLEFLRKQAHHLTAHQEGETPMHARKRADRGSINSSYDSNLNKTGGIDSLSRLLQ